MNYEIKTHRLLLRPFREEDAEELNKISNEPNILKWMPDWKMDTDETRGLIRYFIYHLPLVTKENARIMLAVTLEGRLIGMVGIGNKEEVGNEIETAYYITEAYSGRGYITEAVKALTAWVFQNLKLDYIMAIVEPDNLPSQRVVEKIGFEKLKTIIIVNSGETEEKPFYYYRLYKG